MAMEKQPTGEPNSDKTAADLKQLDIESDQKPITGDGVVDEKIKELRSQLRDTYNVLIEARDTLSSISFDTIKQQSAASASAGGATVQDDIEEVVGAKTVADGLACLEKKMRNNLQAGFASTSLPEVNSLFGALSSLNRGMQEIPGFHENVMQLNDDINKAIQDFEESIEQSRTEFEDLETALREL